MIDTALERPDFRHVFVDFTHKVLEFVQHFVLKTEINFYAGFGIPAIVQSVCLTIASLISKHTMNG